MSARPHRPRRGIAVLTLLSVLGALALLRVAGRVAAGSPESGCTPLIMQAERGDLQGNWQIIQDESASDGAYVEKPVAPAPSMGSIFVDLDISQTGWYEIRARIWGVSSKLTSWRVHVDSPEFTRWMVIPGDQWLNDYPVRGTDGVTRQFHLERGPHRIQFSTESQTVKLDYVKVQCTLGPTATATETGTPTATATETSTPTATATETGTPTPTTTVCAGLTACVTPTPSSSPTATATPTATAFDRLQRWWIPVVYSPLP